MLIYMLLLLFRVGAQDIHYSQFFNSPLNLNPSECGSMVDDFRFSANERTQWKSITVPYQTFSAAFEAGFENKYIPKNRIGAGVLFNADKAGDSEFGTTQVKLSVAAHQTFLSDNSLTVSAGIDVAYNQNSINYGNLYFGNQYNGNRYDPSLSSEETFAQDQLSYVDYTLGAKVRYVIDKQIPVTAGISFIHLNQPEKSFYDNSLIELDRKFNAFGSATFHVKDNLDLSPVLIYMNQGRFQEFNAGGYLTWTTGDPAFRNLSFGVWSRMKDAAFVYLGLQYRNVNLGASYDINTSNLRVASNGKGGLELSLIYVFNRSRYVELPDTKKCPTFI